MSKNRKQDCWYKSVCNLDCPSVCLRYIEMKFLMESSGIPKSRQLPLDLISLNEKDKKAFKQLDEIKNNIKEFVDAGKNLYICSSSTGTAKTSWAFKLMLKYFDTIWPGNGMKVRGLFIHVPTFLQQLKDFDSPLPKSYIDDIKECDLVIWDDIAASDLTKYEYNQLLLYIDTRVTNNKSNIYTSNICTKNTLNKTVGARLASRIFSLAEVITFSASDIREGVKN